jgi:hypothetical protein
MSCCTCNSTPCCCAGQLAPAACCTPTTESVEYTFENGNLIGIGVFDNDTDNLVQFRGVASNSLALTVTLDAANKAIILDFDGTILVADIPTFTETVRGIGEAATQAETNAGIADDKILTPLKLQNRTATETRTGIAEIATQAEVNTGTDDTRIVTPLKLSTFTANLQQGQTFADAVARAAAVPDYVGQFGGQQDVGSGWVAYGTNAGEWNQLLTGNTTSTLTSVATLVEVGNGTFTWDGNAGAATLNFEEFGSLIFFDSTVQFSSSSVDFINGTVNYTATAQIQAAGVSVPANSVMITSGTAGQLSSSLINTFLSSANVQAGWGTPSGTLARTTFASYNGQTISNPPTQAEVQTLDDTVRDNSRRLAALVTDLLARLLPSA